MSNTDTSPRDITTDHETIREWVEQRGGTPAHVSGTADDTARSLYIVEEGEDMENLESISWDEFFETFEAKELAFVYQDRDVGETDEWLYDLIDRQEVAERASLETTDVEQSLLDGEVVRSELTETKVIETTVVETDRIESEIADSEIVESNPVDRETIAREIIGVSFESAPDDLTPTFRSERAEPTTVDRDTGHDSTTAAERDTGHDSTTAEPAADRQHDTESTAGLDVGDGVVLDVHDTVRTTTEVFDRKTIESRVVEQEITEQDAIESDVIDIQGVEETIVESGLIEGEVVTDETGETDTSTAGLPSGAIESERTEGDTIHSQFVERRLVETESTEHHQLMCDIADHMLADTVDSRSAVIERAIVDREAGEEVMLQEPETGVRTTDEQISAAEESATATAGADAELASKPGDSGEAGSTGGSATELQALTGDEIGKQVVSGNKEVGIVSDVDTETQTLYVDPEPSLTDRIKAALDWGDTDDDSYPVDEDQIEAVDDEEIRISEL